MNKIVASFGIAALGASALQSASAQGFGPENSKPWMVSATLRGFYDDNINGAPSGPGKIDSFGFEVSPGVGLDWRNGPTAVKLGYRFSYRHYDEERFQNIPGENTRDSLTHTFDAAIDHAFNERYSISLRDSFTVGQEPDVLRAKEGGGSSLTPVPGDNIRNYGSVVLNAVVTPVLDLEAGYDNQWFDYDDSGAFSLSGILDRIEQTAHLDALWRALPKTQVLLGYQFGIVNYTGDQTIGTPGQNFQESSDKDTVSHYFYTGLNHTFTPDLDGSLKVGARFVDFYNADRDNQVAPYVRANLRYMYAPESLLQVGASYDLTTAPYSQAGNADTALGYLSLRHRIVPKLFANATGEIQHSEYNGGAGTDGQSDLIYTAGLSLEYAFLQNLSAHIGYNFDSVNSDLPNGDYQRNRVYIGVTASY